MCAMSFVFVSGEMCFDAKRKSFQIRHTKREREERVCVLYFGHFMVNNAEREQ